MTVNPNNAGVSGCEHQVAGRDARAQAQLVVLADQISARASVVRGID
jgi:hypothetical protein